MEDFMPLQVSDDGLMLKGRMKLPTDFGHAQLKALIDPEAKLTTIGLVQFTDCAPAYDARYKHTFRFKTYMGYPAKKIPNQNVMPTIQSLVLILANIAFGVFRCLRSV